MGKIFKSEIWIPLIITTVFNIAFMSYTAGNTIADIRDSVNLVSQKLDIYTQRVDANSSAIVILQSHMCKLDTLSGISCIASEN